MVLIDVLPHAAAASRKSLATRRGTARRHGRNVLTLAYSALLAAAFWLLDGTVMPVGSTGVPAGDLTVHQTAPEGWPLWIDEPAMRP